jgi:hypothetical protein
VEATALNLWSRGLGASGARQRGESSTTRGGLGLSRVVAADPGRPSSLVLVARGSRSVAWHSAGANACRGLRTRQRRCSGLPRLGLVSSQKGTAWTTSVLDSESREFGLAAPLSSDAHRGGDHKVLSVAVSILSHATDPDQFP